MRLIHGIPYYTREGLRKSTSILKHLLGKANLEKQDQYSPTPSMIARVFARLCATVFLDHPPESVWPAGRGRATSRQGRQGKAGKAITVAVGRRGRLRSATPSLVDIVNYGRHDGFASAVVMKKF